MSNEKLRNGGAGSLGDLVRQGGDVYANFYNEADIKNYGAGMWADLARNGGDVILDHVPATPPTYLPTVSVAPLAVYGTAKMVQAYSGNCLRVVRASDSATLDVGFDSTTQKIDMASANAHRGVSEHTCDIFYDQSGSGYNALQSTSGNRPRLRSDNAWRSSLQGITHDSYIAATAGTKVSKHFDLPSEVSVNRSDATVFCVVAPRANYQNTAIWEIGTASTARFNLFTTPTVAGVRVAYGSTSSPTVVDTTKYTKMNPEIYVVRTNATNAKIWNGDTITTTTKPTTGTVTSGRIGSAQTLTDYGLRGEMFAWVVYPAGLSDTDVDAIRSALATIYSTAQPNDYVIFEGDSLTEGIADTYLKNAARYVADNCTRSLMMANPAVYGVTAATTYARRVQLWDGLDRTVTGKKICVLALGINDLSASTTADTLWTSYLQPYIAYIKSRGYSVIVCTLTPSKATGFDAGMETERLAINTTIRDNAVSEGYTLCDYCANAIFDAQADADNTTYYTADKVHHTSAAFTVKGQIVLPLIEALLAA